MLRADLEAIAPGNMGRSVDASLRWLSGQTNGNWLLVFDNADNVDLKLKNFFPTCSSGNILITTRNRDLRHYTAKDADADVKGMDLEDAKRLLLVQARAEGNVGNNALAETIVQVNFFLYLIFVETVMTCETGTPLLCLGRRSSWSFHSLPLVLKRVSGALPT